MPEIRNKCPYCNQMYSGTDLRNHYETECRENPERGDKKTNLTDKLERV